MKSLLILCTLCFCTTTLSRARIVDVPSSGVAKAVATLKDGDTLRFEKGARYDFYATQATLRDYYESNTTDVLPKKLAILLHGLNDITILGQGAQLIMHGQMQPLTIDSCTGVRVENLSVDWDIPLTAQSRVVQVTDKGFVVQIDTLQFPYDVQGERVIFRGEGWTSKLFAMLEFRPYNAQGVAIIEPETGDTYSWALANSRATDLGGGKIFFAIDKPNAHTPHLGNYLVMRHNARAHAGVFVQNSKDVSFTDVWLHHTGGLGILCQYTENIAFRSSGVVPNAHKGRYLSGHDDGFHLMGCRGDILVEGCRWQGLMDDPINIHGTSVRIVEILSDKKIKCRFMQSQSVGMQWGQVGNKVGFLEDESLRSLGSSVIKSYNQLSTTDFEVELTKALPRGIEVGDALENLYWVPSNVIISGNIFGGCRARGLLVTVPARVVIENNTFYSSGSAILIAGDAAQWYETGAVKDVLIRNNVFETPCNTSSYQFCMGVISIDPEIARPDAKYPFHSNIRIVDNVFRTSDNPLVYAKSVDGLTFSGNKIERTSEFAPRIKGDKIVQTVDCRNVKIEQ